eukprot:2634773-Rhodomonas_salina.1
MESACGAAVGTRVSSSLPGQTAAPEYLLAQKIDFLVLAGSQVVLWDVRAQRTPVARTPLSAGGHTQPVVKVQVSDSQTAAVWLRAPYAVT